MKYIVEHMEPSLSDCRLNDHVELIDLLMMQLGCALEYAHIISHVGEGNLYLSHLHDDVIASIPDSLKSAVCTSSTVQEMGINTSKILLLDPIAPQSISPDDGDQFDFCLFGGILGDDPPRDRTSELRKLGFSRRNLGLKQMTTDTAVIVTKKIVEDKIAIDSLSFVDRPSIQLSKKSSVQMPFRYLKVPGTEEPLMCPGILDLIRKSNDMDLS